VAPHACLACIRSSCAAKWESIAAVRRRTPHMTNAVRRRSRHSVGRISYCCAPLLPTNRLTDYNSIRCVGIEIVPALHAAAADVWARIAADRPRPAEGAPWPAAVCDDVEFILGCD
jgi:hypothetical protein